MTLGEVSVHRYRLDALLPDYGRAALGTALTIGPVALVELSSIMSVVLGGLGALFVAYGARTLWRQKATFTLDEAGLAVAGPFARRIAWEDLRGVSVRYYSTRRDRAEGWMHLTVRDARRRIAVDSSLDGFARIATAAARAAGRAGLELDDTTRSNLAALDPAHAR